MTAQAAEKYFVADPDRRAQPDHRSWLEPQEHPRRQPAILGNDADEQSAHGAQECEVHEDIPHELCGSHAFLRPDLLEYFW